MSFFKPYCFALLFAVMLVPACSTTPQPAVESPAVVAAAAPAAACDGAVFQGKCVHKGDIVTFGNYPQAAETPEPIEWIVIDVDTTNKRMLLLSKYVLDAKPYDTSHKNSEGKNIYPTWAESDIRKWLNDTGSSGFLRSAYFTARDQSLIVEVTNSTTDYKEDDIRKDGGVDSRDKVFLLDTKEYESYLHYNLGLGSYEEADDDEVNDETSGAESFEEDETNDDEDAMSDVVDAKATTCAIQNGADVQNLSDRNAACAHIQCSAHWWLRSPASYRASAATAEMGGGVFFHWQYRNEYCRRPSRLVGKVLNFIHYTRVAIYTL